VLALSGVVLAAAALGAEAAFGAARYDAAGALACFAGVCAGVLAGLRRHAPHARFGPANVVTLVRAMLVSLLAGLMFGAPGDPAAAWAAVALASLGLMLDGVDGRLARRRGVASRFGARFDMEVDALLLLVLAVLVVRAGQAGPWILAIGLARYIFVAAGRVWPWLRAPLPDSVRRQTVCVVQGVVLTAALAPVVPPVLASGAGAAALALLLLSFGLDIRRLRRHRHRLQGAPPWPATATAAGSLRRSSPPLCRRCSRFRSRRPPPPRRSATASTRST